MEGTIKLPVFGTVRKQTAIIAGVGSVVLVLGIYWYRQHKASQTATSSSAGSALVTDPDGNQCAALASSGYCPGTPGDLAAQQQAASGGYSPYTYGGGGSPLGLTTGTTPVVTTAAFATNAAWAQAAESYLGSNGADATAAALSKYIAGQAITTAQQTVVEEAIAAEGYPPVSGSAGYPPSMNVTSTNTGTGTSSPGFTTPENITGSVQNTTASFAWSQAPDTPAQWTIRQGSTTVASETATSNSSGSVHISIGTLKPKTAYVLTVTANGGSATFGFSTF